MSAEAINLMRGLQLNFTGSVVIHRINLLVVILLIFLNSCHTGTLLHLKSHIAVVLGHWDSSLSNILFCFKALQIKPWPPKIISPLVNPKSKT